MTEQEKDLFIRDYAEKKLAIDTLQGEMDLMKATLIEWKVCHGFLDLGVKVQWSAGSALTEVSNEVVNELTFEQLKKIVKVTEKSLVDLGRDDLVTKYKRYTGEYKADSLLVKALSKDDKKQIEGLTK